MAETTQVAVEKITGRQRARNFVKGYGNIIIFAAVWVAGMIIRPGTFITGTNMLGIINQAAIAAICCLGMTFVLMTGGIDLSVGYLLGFCAYIFGWTTVSVGMPVFIGVLITLAVGAFFGFVNGFLVQIMKIPAFIVTLGTGYIIFGIAQIVSNGKAITPLPDNVLAVGRARFLGLSSMVWIMLLVVAICFFILHKTTFGRALTSVGLNKEASALSGISANFTTIMVYVICGISSALGAILMAARVNNSVCTMGGTEFTFTAITAAVLGGASLFGGIGTAWGSVLGVLTIYTIQNILGLMGVNYYMYTAVQSIIILIAIIFENVKNRLLQ
ncbi:MAG: ABC transporter permease [Eubacterium sp.]|nr:ABC transporter permease [Eubacterium sp.]